MAAIAIILLAQVDGFGAQARLWFADLGGRLEGDSDTVEGSRISVDGDLGFGRERVNDLTVWFVAGERRTSISLYEVEARESETLPEPVTFEGILFPGGTRVQAELQLQVGRLLLEERFVDASAVTSTFRASWLNGLQRYDASVEIDDADKHVRTYGLTTGLLVEAAIAPNFFVGGHVLWAPKVTWHGRTTRYLELEGSLRLEVDGIDGTLGYRHVDLLLAKDSTEIDLGFSGWFAGVGFAF